MIPVVVPEKPAVINNGDDDLGNFFLVEER
jgi:hypothetical protein